jgi:hypothetical protein
MDEVKAALPATASSPRLLAVDGIPRILAMMSIDNSRREIRMETGGAFTGSVTEQPSPMPEIPVSVPIDAFYVKAVPGASWGSWQKNSRSS